MVDLPGRSTTVGHEGEFRKFDKRYNGYIFKAHFSEELTVPPDSLVDFIRSLYPPVGPYRFDAIADDILGIIYERFLGSAITVTRGHVEAEPKPEVRHAGGVYYTPKFVVDTIVRRVVAPKVEGKSPVEILDVKILDPACGSGSFLIAALQYLYSHCLKCFEKDRSSAVAEVMVKRGKANRKVKKKLGFQDAGGNWYLMPEFRGQLLESCMYGVDIDAQAVEVTIMSLYLKMLEGRLPKDWQRDFLEARLLPPLDNNIRCGNSLISQTDFDRYWENKFGGLFGGDSDVRFRMNAFDWTSQTRGFGRIFEERKGFDCVIGNPPYIRVQELNKWALEECAFYKYRYDSAASGNYDIYVVFIEKALSLLAPDGLLGFICPHKFWQAAYGKSIRETIARGKHLKSIVDFTDQQVFRGATTYTGVHIFSKGRNDQPVHYAAISSLVDGDIQCNAIDKGDSGGSATIFDAQRTEGAAPWVFVDTAKQDWLSRVRGSNPLLGAITTKIAQGIVSGCDPAFYVEKRGSQYFSACTSEVHEIETDLVHPLLKGSVHMRRWLPDVTNLAVVFPYRRTGKVWNLIPPDEMRNRYPKAAQYFQKCIAPLERREDGRFKGPEFYQFSRPQNFEVMGQAKVLVPAIATRAEFCLDLEGESFFVGSGGGGGGGYGILPSIDMDLAYLCGLLNSKLLDVFLKAVTTRFHSGWFAYSKLYLEQLPVKLPGRRGENRLAEQVSDCVMRIVQGKKGLRASQLSQREREQLEREVEAHEKEIDELVCELYGVKEIPE